MYSQAGYEMNEIRRFIRESQEKEHAPLADRKQGKSDFISCLNKNLQHFFDCCIYLIQGDYGAGAHYAFKQMTKRSNRKAWIFNHVGIIEFGTSMKYACEAWHSLDTDLQAAINARLDIMLEQFDRGDI